MSGFNDGKSYGINFLLVPETSRTDGQFPDPASGSQTYDVQVSINGLISC